MSHQPEHNKHHPAEGNDARYAELGRLTDGMLHDMVNPLTALAFRIELMEQEDDLSTHLKEQLKLAHKDIDAVKEFITATKRHIPTDPEIALFSPVRELQLIANMLAFKMREGNITLNIIGDESIETYGDAACFYDAFFGMLLTLCDSILEQNTKHKHISIEVESPNGSIIITIKQNVLSLKNYLHGIEVLAKQCDASVREVGEGIYTTTIVMTKHEPPQ